jgi:hypothetical protein
MLTVYTSIQLDLKKAPTLSVVSASIEFLGMVHIRRNESNMVMSLKLQYSMTKGFKRKNKVVFGYTFHPREDVI